MLIHSFAKQFPSLLTKSIIQKNVATVKSINKI